MNFAEHLMEIILIKEDVHKDRLGSGDVYSRTVFILAAAAENGGSGGHRLFQK